MSAELYVKRAKRCFDMIFCDPPFPYRYKWELIRTISSSCLVKENSLILLHRPREDRKQIDDQENHLVKENHREYGRSVVDFFRIKIRK